MSQKRSRKSEGGRIAKRPRVVMTLQQKLEILNKLKAGMTNSKVARLYCVNESTIRSIRQNENAIRDSVKNGTSLSLKVTCYPRDRNLEKTEHVLNLWIKEQMHKGVFMNSISIRNHAKKLYLYFSGEEDSLHFLASKGWFENFKKRYSLQNLKAMSGSASADHQVEQEEYVCKRLSSGEEIISDKEQTLPILLSNRNDNSEDFSASELSLKEFAASICQTELEKITSEKDPLSDEDLSSDNVRVSSSNVDNSEDVPECHLASEKSTRINPCVETKDTPFILDSYSLLQVSNTGRRKRASSKVSLVGDSPTKKVASQVTSKNLKEFLAKAKELAEMSVRIDPLRSRSLKFKKALEGIIQPYTKLNQVQS